MDIINLVHEKILNSVNDLKPSNIENLTNLQKIVVELPKNKAHGCLATNAALVMAKDFKKSPMQLAENFKSEFSRILPEIQQIDIAKPGFINLTFKPGFWQNALAKITHDPNILTKINIGNKEKLNIEFGSPNPTGPLHVGHTRGAIYGDILANILEFVGYDVTRENYSNDAGSQITVLVNSLYKRYIECCTGKSLTIEKPLYPGEYLIPIAQNIHDIHKEKFFINESSDCPKEYFPTFKEIAISEMSELIKSGFKSLNITHDVFFSEQSLHDENVISEVTNLLEKQEKTYIGSLPKPKGKEIENWQPTDQLLFKSTNYGDDIDRALQKSDGTWTYFAADCAYHYNKLSRGFNKMILILGADHGGYIKRMKALINALSDGKANIEIKTCQLVKFAKNGEALKMSKRDGSFITAEEVVKQVGADSLRFIMLTRKNDAVLEFDIEKAVDQSKDNPIFYVQYAHARINSVFRKYNTQELDKPGNINQSVENKNEFIPPKNLDYLEHLTLNEELNLIKYLSIFPQTITNIAKNYEPHHLAFYLLELAGLFHAYWHLGKIDPDIRFISDDQNLTLARLTLLHNIKKIIATGLNLFNINPVEEMN